MAPTEHASPSFGAQANRSAAPWIVVNGHRPLYCSCYGDCDSGATLVRDGVAGLYGLEELFVQYGVDLYICGHEHDYERMYDVAPHADSKAPWLSGKTTKATTDMPATTCAHADDRARPPTVTPLPAAPSLLYTPAARRA